MECLVGEVGGCAGGGGGGGGGVGFTVEERKFKIGIDYNDNAILTVTLTSFRAAMTNGSHKGLK